MTWLCVYKNPKESTKKLLALVNKFSKVAGTKFIVFLYNNDEQTENEILRIHL